MTDWIKKNHKSRCEGKQAFRKASLADEQAEKATNKTRTLIISYQCCDCGWWHIGHADETQILARVPTSKPTCIICGNLIHEGRLQKAKESCNRTQTCSKLCAQEATRRRSRLRKLAKKAAQQPDESDQT